MNCLTLRCHYCSDTKKLDKVENLSSLVQRAQVIVSAGWIADLEMREKYVFAFCSASCHLKSQVQTKTHLKIVRN